MDGKATITTEQEGNGFYLAQFKTPELAIYTYYLESNKEAIIIDPTYDTQVFREFINKRNSNLKLTLLTHYHADFLAGHTQFEAPIAMGPKSKKEVNKFALKEHEEGAAIHIGEVKLEVIHTPGHTNESSCYLLHDKGGKAACLFTGDTLFLGDVGRPDLAVDPNAKVEDQAAVMFDSLQKLKKLDKELRFYPGHGGGSSCGGAIGAGNFCTIGNQFQKNKFFKLTDKQEFVKTLVGTVTAPPKYFKHDAQMNQSALSPFTEKLAQVNHPLSVEQFKALSEKMPVIDSRINPEAIIKSKNVYWLTAKATLVNWAAGIVLPSPQAEFIIFTEPGKWQETAERLLRIGYFNIKGYNNFGINDWKGETWKPKIVNYDGLKQIPDVTVLDVRNKKEWQETGIVENAVTIPLNTLEDRVGELKGRKNIVVHCRTGMRARVAHAILAQNGIDSTVLAETVTEFKDKGGLKMVDYKE